MLSRSASQRCLHQQLVASFDLFLWTSVAPTHFTIFLENTYGSPQKVYSWLRRTKKALSRPQQAYRACADLSEAINVSCIHHEQSPTLYIVQLAHSLLLSKTSQRHIYVIPALDIKSRPFARQEEDYITPRLPPDLKTPPSIGGTGTLYLTTEHTTLETQQINRSLSSHLKQSVW